MSNAKQRPCSYEKVATQTQVVKRASGDSVRQPGTLLDDPATRAAAKLPPVMMAVAIPIAVSTGWTSRIASWPGSGGCWLRLLAATVSGSRTPGRSAPASRHAVNVTVTSRCHTCILAADRLHEAIDSLRVTGEPCGVRTNRCHDIDAENAGQISQYSGGLADWNPAR